MARSNRLQNVRDWMTQNPGIPGRQQRAAASKALGWEVESWEIQTARKLLKNGSRTANNFVLPPGQIHPTSDRELALQLIRTALTLLERTGT